MRRARNSHYELPELRKIFATFVNFWPLIVAVLTLKLKEISFSSLHT